MKTQLFEQGVVGSFKRGNGIGGERNRNVYVWIQHECGYCMCLKCTNEQIKYKKIIYCFGYTYLQKN